MREKLVAFVGAVVLCSLLFAGPAQSSAVPTLIGTVGAQGSVSLERMDGKSVHRLRRGVYRIVVHDRSRRDNFDLIGPQSGVRHSTTMTFVGTVTWRLRLVIGVYRYGSDRLPKAYASFRVV